MKPSKLIAILAGTVACPQVVSAKAPVLPSQERSGVSGPDQVDNQIGADALALPHWELSFLEPYHGFKKQLREDTGFSFGIDYSTVALGSTATLEESWSASGMVRLFGAWDLLDRKGAHQGGLVFKVEHRHSYTNVDPASFGFNIGYAGLELPPFSNQDARLTNLYWRQGFFDKRVVLLAGYLDPTDYLDVYGLASPWLHFMNFAFSTGSGSISVPNEGAGVALGGWLTDQVYLLGNLSDVNSDQTRPWETFESFFTSGQFFKSLELGFVSERGRAYLDNVHLTFWHSSEKSINTDPEGWGLNASGTWYFADKWLPFLRAGYAKDGGSLYSGSVSTGVGFQWVPGQDLVALGLNWSRPNETTFGPGLEDQVSAELFYRWQITQEIALTPDVQVLINPALHPTVDAALVGGARLRVAL